MKNSIHSDDQSFFHEFPASLGYRTEVCRSWWSAGKIVNEHPGIKVPVYGR